MRIPRLPWDAYFMLQAHFVATRSTCDRGPGLLLDPGRHGVGAVVVRDRRVIASGYNGSPPGEPQCDRIDCVDCDWGGRPEEATYVYCPDCGGDVVGGHIIRDGSCVRTLHAEENAILQCAIDGTSIVGATVYTTAGPCYDCAKRIVGARVARLVFGAAYESRYGMSSDALVLLSRADVRTHHLPVEELRRRGVET